MYLLTCRDLNLGKLQIEGRFMSEVRLLWKAHSFRLMQLSPEERATQMKPPSSLGSQHLQCSSFPPKALVQPPINAVNSPPM